MMEPSLQLSAPDKEASILWHKAKIKRVVKVNFFTFGCRARSLARLGVLCC